MRASFDYSHLGIRVLPKALLGVRRPLVPLIAATTDVLLDALAHRVALGPVRAWDDDVYDISCALRWRAGSDAVLPLWNGLTAESVAQVREATAKIRHLDPMIQDRNMVAYFCSAVQMTGRVHARVLAHRGSVRTYDAVLNYVVADTVSTLATRPGRPDALRAFATLVAVAAVRPTPEVLSLLPVTLAPFGRGAMQEVDGRRESLKPARNDLDRLDATATGKRGLNFFSAVAGQLTDITGAGSPSARPLTLAARASQGTTPESSPAQPPSRLGRASGGRPRLSLVGSGVGPPNGSRPGPAA